jgi:hemoglobin
MAEPTLYERLGGIFAIAAVVDNFSDRLLKNPTIVQANPELHQWHTVTYPGRLPGLECPAMGGRCAPLPAPICQI